MANVEITSRGTRSKYAMRCLQRAIFAFECLLRDLCDVLLAWIFDNDICLAQFTIYSFSRFAPLEALRLICLIYLFYNVSHDTLDSLIEYSNLNAVLCK